MGLGMISWVTWLRLWLVSDYYLLSCLPLRSRTLISREDKGSVEAPSLIVMVWFVLLVMMRCVDICSYLFFKICFYCDRHIFLFYHVII